MGGINNEVLFVGTAEAEHLEMYLKAIWHIKEDGEEAKISNVAKRLNVRQPSVVQMLKKLRERKLVQYNKSGVRLTEDGMQIGSSMIRNSRLLEVLMDSALKIGIDEEMVCGIEHHMNKQTVYRCHLHIYAIFAEHCPSTLPIVYYYVSSKSLSACHLR